MTSHPTHPAHRLLSRAHSPTTAQTLFTDRVKNKPLILRRPRAAPQERVLPAQAETATAVGEGEAHLGRLNRVWRGYVREVLGLDGTAGGNNNIKVVSAQHHGALLASLDYHGAEIEVVRCACVGRVGTRGIVVRDTKFTFVVVTRADEVRTIPKRDAIFRFEVPVPEGEEEGTSPEKETRPPQQPLVFELHGNQFEMRAADRANKKFKWKSMEYL
ncbi:hypothetical protein EPUS_01954 [Endocarpon pusillum Z07020]|uniref:Ribonuclease P protein subunit n=1 Tax=Endocarpon pusillum (strain Z07020 / HMAS-L-300199) TaxID=1263415 RepID=U1G9V0_ENDPU|nr:uncharacterized protein EPUS_01954 [Endocarpon pusillum Z07020]ERF74267.1 hypothetical protein EPUS_01954 [Endocarpon pusillum Z07020]